MGIGGVSGIRESYFLKFGVEGCLFILGGEYVKEEEGCVGVLLPEPIGDCGMTELPIA